MTMRTNVLFFCTRKYPQRGRVEEASLENVALEEGNVAEEERNVANRRILLQILPW